MLLASKSIYLFMRKVLATMLFLSVFIIPVSHSAIEEVHFDNPIDAVRYKDMIAELRCLVCQNQNLEDSSAPLALDLKKLVEELIKAGKGDQEVYLHLTERYGDFVLYKPPLKGTTYLLWFGPLLFLLIGALIFFGQIRKRNKPTENN